jgi:hypothetical protein
MMFLWIMASLWAANGITIKAIDSIAYICEKEAVSYMILALSGGVVMKWSIKIGKLVGVVTTGNLGVLMRLREASAD